MPSRTRDGLVYFYFAGHLFCTPLIRGDITRETSVCWSYVDNIGTNKSCGQRHDTLVLYCVCFHSLPLFVWLYDFRQDHQGHLNELCLPVAQHQDRLVCQIFVFFFCLFTLIRSHGQVTYHILYLFKIICEIITQCYRFLNI